MASYRTELSISPLSHSETEHVLTALRQTWQQPACINRQNCGDAYLLSIRHEAELGREESIALFAERLAASLWQAIGRFARISLEIARTDEEAEYFCLEEKDYRRILPDFRLSRTPHPNA